MRRSSQLAILLVAMIAGYLTFGCRKEKQPAESRVPPSAGKAIEKRETKACEKTVTGYLDALAANDYMAAVDLIDVEEMLEKKGQGTATFWAPANAAEMKQKLFEMMEAAAKQRKGKLTYEILGSHVSGQKATVEVEVYRDGRLVDKEAYRLTRRDGEWKLSGQAIRALFPPMERPPSPTPSQ